MILNGFIFVVFDGFVKEDIGVMGVFNWGGEYLYFIMEI